MQETNFIQNLKTRLLKPLPGLDSHIKMLPIERRNVLRPESFGMIPLQSSVLILVFPENDNIYTLLIKRTEDKGVHSGQISFPGGKKDENDRSALDTAIRELQEETGLVIDAPDVIGLLSPLYVSPSNFEIIPVIAYRNHLQTLVPNPEEVEYIIKAPLSELENLKTTRDITVREYLLRQVPCFIVDENIIWGATAMILQELIDVLTEIDNQH